MGIVSTEIQKIKGKTIAVVYTFEGDTSGGLEHFFVWKSNIISNWLNAIEELDILKQIGIEYVILNAFLIPEDIFVEVLKTYEELTEENKKQLYHRIQQLLPNCDKGFLYKETIYKVK